MFDLHDYESRYAAHYEGPSFEPIIVRMRRRAVIASLSAHPHRRILEVGCGLEPLFLAIEDFDRFVVVEPAAAFVDAARARAEGRADISVHQGFLEDVAPQLSSEDFDFIVVSSLLHEVADPQRLLAGIRGLCGASTVVHFNVPNVYSFHRLLAVEMGLIPDLFEQSETERRFQRHTRFDRARLQSILATNGFQVLDTKTYFVKPFTHSQMQGLLDAKIIDMKVIDGLERMVKYLPDMGCEVYAEAIRSELTSGSV